MSGDKGLEYHRIVKKEPISRSIADIEAHNENNSEDVVIVENIVPDPEMVELTDSDSDTKVQADQASTEVQNLKNKVSSLEKLWEVEKQMNRQLRQALIETMEGQDKLKIQIGQMGATSNTSCAAPDKKGKRKTEDHDLGKPNKKKWKRICYLCGYEGHTTLYCPDYKKRSMLCLWYRRTSGERVSKEKV